MPEPRVFIPVLSNVWNRFPQGAPPSDLLFAILKMLFSEEEAGLVTQLPIRPFRASDAARVWKMNPDKARKILDQLASRAILVDIPHNGESRYCLPPPISASACATAATKWPMFTGITTHPRISA